MHGIQKSYDSMGLKLQTIGISSGNQRWICWIGTPAAWRLVHALETNEQNC